MTYEVRQLTDRMDLQVNVANGNAVIHNTDSAITGTGLNQTVERSWNSLGIPGRSGFGRVRNDLAQSAADCATDST